MPVHQPVPEDRRSDIMDYIMWRKTGSVAEAQHAAREWLQSTLDPDPDPDPDPNPPRG